MNAAASAASTGAGRAVLRMETLLSPRVGIGRNLSRVQPGTMAPRVILHGVESAPAGALGTRMPRSNCGGAGLSVEESKASALGELVESYCGSFVPPEARIVGTFDEVSRQGEPLEPERFAFFSARQHSRLGFPFQPFTRTTRVAWVKGYSLVRGREVLVPAARVYMPYPMLPGEANLAPMTSTGMAAGDSRERAILSGLYECVERDAFTIFWMNQLSVRAVDITGSAAEQPLRQLFEERFATPGYGYRAFEITNDLGVPTVFVVLVHERAAAPLYAMGAASRLDGVDATRKALIEAVQSVPYIAYLVDQDPDWRPAPDYSNLDDFTHNARVYTLTPELRPKLLSVAERVRASVTLEQLPRWADGGPTAAIEHLTGVFAKLGYEAVVVDLTTPDVAALGMSVVRVIVPELATLHGVYRFPFLGCARLYEVPVRLAERAVPGDEGSLETAPHPFP